MNLSTMLQQRAAGGRPVRTGLVGAGKFGSMVLAQAQRIPGLHVVGVADLDVGKARASLARVGWPAERYGAASLGRSEEHTSELQSRQYLVCRLLLEKKKKTKSVYK